MPGFSKIILLSLYLLLLSSKGLEAQFDSISLNTKYAVADGIGNLIVLTEGNSILKLDSNLKITNSLNLISYGVASSIECNGGTEVIVYCYNTGQLVVFDNFFKEKIRYDFRQLLIPKPTIICMSKTGWWCYDETTSSISNYRSNFQKVYSLPKVPYLNSGQELVKMAEMRFTFPKLLFTNGTLIIPDFENVSSGSDMGNQYKFHVTPSLNYNTEELFDYSNDSLICLTFRSATVAIYKVIQTKLGLKNVTMVAKSFNTFFFIEPNSICSFQNLHH